MENTKNNLFLIESDNHILINKLIKKILKENNFKEEDLVTYDLDTSLIDDVINDLDTYSLFTGRKIIHASNCRFLTTDKSLLEHNIDLFTKYINNPSDNILIISCRNLDSKKNIAKLVKSNFKSMDTTLDLVDYVEEKTEGYQFSIMDINYFLSFTKEDLDKIDNELNKLLLYKMDDKVITKDDIDKVVIRKIDDNIFDFIEAIIKKDKKKSLEIYQDLLNSGEEVFKIIISLANQIRLLYQVKVLQDLKDEDIAKELGLKNPKQLYFLRKKISGYKESELINYLHKLSLIDEELKLGKGNEQIILPIFIASL